MTRGRRAYVDRRVPGGHRSGRIGSRRRRRGRSGRTRSSPSYATSSAGSAINPAAVPRSGASAHWGAPASSVTHSSPAPPFVTASSVRSRTWRWRPRMPLSLGGDDAHDYIRADDSDIPADIRSFVVERDLGGLAAVLQGPTLIWFRNGLRPSLAPNTLSALPVAGLRHATSVPVDRSIASPFLPAPSMLRYRRLIPTRLGLSSGSASNCSNDGCPASGSRPGSQPFNARSIGFSVDAGARRRTSPRPENAAPQTHRRGNLVPEPGSRRATRASRAVAERRSADRGCGRQLGYADREFHPRLHPVDGKLAQSVPGVGAVRSECHGQCRVAGEVLPTPLLFGYACDANDVDRAARWRMRRSLMTANPR